MLLGCSHYIGGYSSRIEANADVLGGLVIILKNNDDPEIVNKIIDNWTKWSFEDALKVIDEYDSRKKNKEN